MVFFIGGFQPKTIYVDKHPRNCPVCSHISVYHKRIDYYLSLFFIPLFPVKKGTSFLACNNCNSILDEKGRIFRGQQPENKCSFCGRSVGEDFIFCPYCGKSVGKEHR